MAKEKELESTMKFKADITELKAGFQEACRQIKLANAEFKSATSGIDNWAKSTDGLIARKKQLTTIIDTENKKLEILKNQHALVVKEQGENSKGAQELEIKIKNQEAAVNKATKSMQTFDQELINAYKSGSITKEAFNSIASESTKLAAKTQLAEESMRDLKEVSNELAHRASKALINGFKAVAVSIAGVIAASAKVGISFEAAMSEVGAIANATTQELDALKEKAKEIGATTKFSATQAAEAFKYMAMAGWDVSDMLNGIDGVMQLAASSGEELGTVADIVTDGLTAFGLSAQDAGRFADVLATASSKANTNVSMMGESFKEAAALSGTMGYSIEDLALGIGLMANSGIKGSKAGTSLKNAIANMASPTNAMTQLMNEYNLSLSNADGTMKPFKQVVDELRVAFGKLTKDQQASAAATLFGKEGMAGMLAVINASEADYNKLSMAINNSSGAAKRMADTMNDNVKGSFTVLGSTLEGIGIKIFELFKTQLNDSLKDVTSSFNKFSKELDKPELKNAIKTIGDGFASLIKTVGKFVTSTLPPLMSGISFLIKNGKVLTPIITGLGAAWLAHNTKVAIASKSTKDLNAIQLIAKTGMVAYKAVVGLLTGSINAQTLATKALAAAQAMTPWGAIAAGVGAVAMGMIALSSGTSEADRVQKEITETLREETESWNELKKAQLEQVQAGVSEIDHLKNLKTELDTLVDANGKIKEGYEQRANFIINEISEATDTEIDVVDGVIQKYSELSQSIDTLIAKKRAKIIVESQEQAYAEAIKNKTEALATLNQREQEYLDANREYHNARQELDNATTELEKMNAGTRLWHAEEEYNTKKANYENQANLVKGYNDTIAQYEYDAKLLASGTAEDLALINERIKASYDDKGQRVVLSLQEQIANEERELAYWRNQYETTHNEMYNDQVLASNARLEQLKRSLEEQTATIDVNTPGYATMWEIMSKSGVSLFSANSDEYRISALQQTLNAKKGISEGTDETLAAWKYLSEQGLAEYKENGWEYTQAGEEVVNGVRKGIENKQGSIFDKMNALGTSMINSLKSSLDIHSPSRKMKTIIGYNIPLGIAEGILYKMPVVNQTLSRSVDGLVNNISKKMPTMKQRLQRAMYKINDNLQLSNTKYLGVYSNMQKVRDVPNNNQTFNFNQTIHSPKALSRLEIYRQTNNMLFSAKARFKNG